MRKRMLSLAVAAGVTAAGGMESTPPKIMAATASATAASVALPNTKGLPAAAAKAEIKAVHWLLAHQNKTGAWLHYVGPAGTALVVKGLIQAGYSPNFPAVKKAIKYIESYRQADGGFYKNALPNYNTAIVLSTLAVLPHQQYAGQIKKAQKFLISMQFKTGMKTVQGKTVTPKSAWYGGVGYGHSRPDLSNTSFFIQALHDSGVPASNPALKRALVFVTRCQMNSETNPMKFARGVNNGGFIYSAALGGKSAFGDTDKLTGGSVLTAYGTMTYSGLKSMIYCGLTKKDPRVQAAIKWIRHHWTLSSNPGTGGSRMGLFYYFLMFSRALHALHMPVVHDASGVNHHWRREMDHQLVRLQFKSGYWKNTKSGRWLEFNPTLVTSYCLLILEETQHGRKNVW